jgi:ribulose-5-phosphate 4-epimerase/fuculose-1-phosphate aldolase
MDTTFEALMDDLVAANRILSAEGVVDAFGHVSVRHPQRTDRFLLSRARPPELVERKDIMEFTLEGDPVDPRGRKPYLERFLHGAIYEARTEFQSVIHNHSHSLIPFGITGQKLRPLLHSSAIIGQEVPVWDTQRDFGDTDLLISDMVMGRDFARLFVHNRCVLMRGHGSTVAGKSIREAVYTAIYLEVNANLQLKASQLGTVQFLSEGEIAKISQRLTQARAGEGFDRAWEYWCRHAGIALGHRS